MKTLALFVSILFLAVMSVNAQNEVKQQGVPDIKWDDGTSYDFGEVIDGSVVEHNFNFTNTGTAPLLIKNCKASCGCTAPDWTREPVPPGGKGFVKARFNSSGYGGRNFSKTITVTTNIPDGTGQDKSVVVFFSGKGIAKQAEMPQYPVKIVPASYDFGQIKQGKPVKWTINVVNEGDSALVLRQVRSTDNNITTKWTPKAVKKGEVIAVEFTLNTKTIDPKKINEVITFVTNIPETSTKLISVTGLVLTGEIIKK